MLYRDSLVTEGVVEESVNTSDTAIFVTVVVLNVDVPVTTRVLPREAVPVVVSVFKSVLPVTAKLVPVALVYVRSSVFKLVAVALTVTDVEATIFVTKVRSLFATKCQKIESKMQKKIDMYKE